MYYVVAGRHPALGYVDEPPLTPLLSAASVVLLGVSPTAVRVLPAIEMALVVIVVALISLETWAALGARCSWRRSWPHCPATSARAISTPRPRSTCSPGRSSCGWW
jgi:hypothetical protein